ncbi:hypothetical protein TREMEDRAFT_71211 [Tremella mesenterica DSM 1558]|uniref:uncharacterized protein n=1 Tax=Tremella mesenterica (strain ATCC 24925 / CBS 8224 / DSM 1558 / NBRC 9311 / NRRL Y-6157 / RJB 2259-6 / UBC 559-6) TaxID=578456 RepID=UPI0003F49FEC|nr:uncharacterized protein TREMEDRAFT_71211 [Tremella mesenterica DSM 1558]EIW71611.1 hypothetical protein TREMEDRAFT_71211 [Tremella mesenterica DSM 1558]
MAAHTPRCLVRGSINIDEFFSLPHIVLPGETISSTRYAKRAGGKGANQAYACAQAGGGVDMDGCIGSDGIWVKDMLQKAGVGVDRVRLIEHEVSQPMSNFGEKTKDRLREEPLFNFPQMAKTLSVLLHAGANANIPSSDTSPDVSSYTHLLVQNEIPLSSTLTYLSLGLINIFNPSPMLSPSELRTFPWASLTWLIVNQGELAYLLSALSDQPFAMSDNTSEAVNGQLRTLHCTKGFEKVSVICTLGADGIAYLLPLEDEGEVRRMSAGRVEGGVKDTTGAGDTFTGYFVAGLMACLELDEILRNCMTACAICVERSGAMESIPTKVEVLERQASQKTNQT